MPLDRRRNSRRSFIFPATCLHGQLSFQSAGICMRRNLVGEPPCIERLLLYCSSRWLPARRIAGRSLPLMPIRPDTKRDVHGAMPKRSHHLGRATTAPRPMLRTIFSTMDGRTATQRASHRIARPCGRFWTDTDGLTPDVRAALVNSVG